MKIGNSTIEKMGWWVILLLLLTNIATLAKLTSDDAKKFRILRHNQDTLICVVKGFADHPTPPDFINACVKTNQ